jgi:hypothetical protein
MLGALASRLSDLTREPLSGTLYIDAKLAYRFYLTRDAGGFDVALRGPIVADYRFEPKSQRVTLRSPGNSHAITLAASSNLQSIEWLMRALYTGRPVDTDVPYAIQRKLGTTLDAFVVKIPQGAIRELEVNIHSDEGNPSLLSVKAKDPSNLDYLFLFD